MRLISSGIMRLYLKAVAQRDVSKLLVKLHIEASSVVDDTLALLPSSLSSLFEGISENEIELQISDDRLVQPAKIRHRCRWFGDVLGTTDPFL